MHCSSLHQVSLTTCRSYNTQKLQHEHSRYCQQAIILILHFVHVIVQRARAAQCMAAENAMRWLCMQYGDNPLPGGLQSSPHACGREWRPSRDELSKWNLGKSSSCTPALPPALVFLGWLDLLPAAHAAVDAQASTMRGSQSSACSTCMQMQACDSDTGIEANQILTAFPSCLQATSEVASRAKWLRCVHG